MRGNHDNYDHVSCDVIARFLTGDSKAFEIVIERYGNYLHRCLTDDARKKDIDPESLELPDLKQEIWMEYDRIMRVKFKIKKSRKQNKKY